LSDVFTVKVTGLSQLQERLESLPKKVAQRIIRTTLKDIGNVLRNDMVDLAPKHTGLMSENFNVIVRLTGNELAARAWVGPKQGVYYPGGDKKKGSATGKNPKKGGTISTRSVARFQEFGTEGEHPIPANDFMKRAFDQWQPYGLSEMIAAIKDELDKAGA